ncbi:MAG: deoxyribodipyrimidine photo-lyase [Woeseiaceae bacterium]
MKPVLLWFRRNLRLADNASLLAAARTGRPVIPVYIVDEQDSGTASRWWLHHSLASLDKDLRDLGAPLVLRSGSPVESLAALAAETGADGLYYARRFEPVSRRQEKELAAALGEQLEIHDFGDSLLHDPNVIQTKSGSAFKVFTPFWKSASNLGEPPVPLPGPAAIRFAANAVESLSLHELNLLPDSAQREERLGAHWAPGESHGLTQIDEFAAQATDYKQLRDRPDIDATSRLSPYLHFGEVSVRQIWHAIRQVELQRRAAEGGAAFLRQLYWREFSTYLLLNFPSLPEQPLRTEFERFPWRDSDAHLQAWQRGETGYPIVDAGMRQLKETGWMHNRVRMIAASFLVKDLLVPWQTGAAWFLDTLVDADLANNSASWQWVAGCGTDAAPYFRVFNPTLQGDKFDPHGRYIRQWLPELADGSDSRYPQPIVDHGEARKRALEAYQAIRAA